MTISILQAGETYIGRQSLFAQDTELPYWLAIGPICWEFIDRDVGRYPWKIK